MTYRIHFIGNFWEFFLGSLLLFLFGIITLGLGWIYMAYWQAKYFVAHLEIVLPAPEEQTAA